MNGLDGRKSETIFREKCHECGLRVTPQRLAIFRLVHKSKEHPNADAVYRKIRKRFSNISFDTVNRTLLSFARIGILKIVEGYGNPKRFDPMVENHHHFHCLSCNRIIDFHDSSIDGFKAPESLSRQFTVIHTKLVVEGICDRCSP